MAPESAKSSARAWWTWPRALVVGLVLLWGANFVSTTYIDAHGEWWPQTGYPMFSRGASDTIISYKIDVETDNGTIRLEGTEAFDDEHAMDPGTNRVILRAMVLSYDKGCRSYRTFSQQGCVASPADEWRAPGWLVDAITQGVRSRGHDGPFTLVEQKVHADSTEPLTETPWFRFVPDPFNGTVEVEPLQPRQVDA